MQARGFEESQSAYVSDPSRGLVGQVRRFGADGPAYEIMSIDSAGNAEIAVVCSGERVTCPVSDVIEDPVAETIP